MLPVGAASPPPLGSRFRGNDGTEVSAPCGHRRLCPARQTAGVPRTRHSVLRPGPVMARRPRTAMAAPRRPVRTRYAAATSPTPVIPAEAGIQVGRGWGVLSPRPRRPWVPALAGMTEQRFQRHVGIEARASHGNSPGVRHSALRPGPVMPRRPPHRHAAATPPHTRHSRGSGNPCWVGLRRVVAATPPPLGSRFRGNDGTEVTAPCGYRGPCPRTAIHPASVIPPCDPDPSCRGRRPNPSCRGDTPTPVIPAEAGIHSGRGWGVSAA